MAKTLGKWQSPGADLGVQLRKRSMFALLPTTRLSSWGTSMSLGFRMRGLRAVTEKTIQQTSHSSLSAMAWCRRARSRECSHELLRTLSSDRCARGCGPTLDRRPRSGVVQTDPLPTNFKFSSTRKKRRKHREETTHSKRGSFNYKPLLGHEHYTHRSVPV